MASIHKERGKWSIRWRCAVTGDNRRYTPKDQRKRSVEQLCRDIEQACDRGVRWTPASARIDEVPALDVMVAELLLARSRKLRPGSVHQLTLVLGQFIDSLRALHGLSETSRLGPSMLTQESLGAFFDHQVHVRGNLPRTAAARVSMVTDTWRRLHEHPKFGDFVPRPRPLEDLPDTNSPGLPAPTWMEMDRAIAHAWGWYRQVFTVQRFTGLRVGQVMRARWEDVDLEGATLFVRPELGKSQQERRGRTIPLSPHLVAELRTWERSEPFIVATGTPLRTCGHHPMMKAWRRAGVRPEVWKGPEGVRGQPSHAFRHGFITGLRVLGADKDLVRYLVGHAPPDVTTSEYTDFALMEEPLRETVALVPPLQEVEVVLPYKGRGWNPDALPFPLRSRNQRERGTTPEEEAD